MKQEIAQARKTLQEGKAAIESRRQRQTQLDAEYARLALVAHSLEQDRDRWNHKNRELRAKLNYLLQTFSCLNM